MKLQKLQQTITTQRKYSTQYCQSKSNQTLINQHKSKITLKQPQPTKLTVNCIIIEVSNQLVRQQKIKQKKNSVRATISHQKEDGALKQNQNLNKQKSLSLNHLNQRQTFLCRICQRNFDINLNQNICLCPHSFCKSCLNHYVLYKIRMFEKITCSDQFCDGKLINKHDGTCQDNQIKFYQNNFHYKQCSKCKMIVQKISGCDHITCTCGNQFCYKCGQRWQAEHLCYPKANNYFLNYQGQQVQPRQVIQQDMCVQIMCAVFKFSLKLYLYILNLLLLLINAGNMINFVFVILFCCLIGGFIVGPFIYLNRLKYQDNCLLMTVIILLFPLAMLMGVKIALVEWFYSLSKPFCQYVPDLFVSICQCIYQI